MRFRLTLVRGLLSGTQKMNAGKDVRKKELFCIVVGIVN